MHEYLFDVKLFAAIRVTASSPAEAIAKLRNGIDCSTGNFGCFANGDPITGEVSIDGEPDLIEIDGEAAEWAGSPCPVDPDNFWIDDATGERVNATTGERNAPKKADSASQPATDCREYDWRNG